MNLLFSFLKPDCFYSTLLDGYFTKVVVSLMMHKTVPFMNFIQVLVRLIGVDEHMYTNYMDEMQWFEETNVLEMIVDKVSSSCMPMQQKHYVLLLDMLLLGFRQQFLALALW